MASRIVLAGTHKAVNCRSGFEAIGNSGEMADLRSHDSDILWPAVVDAAGAMSLALQFQLEQSQWWSGRRLLERQFAQLARLVRHAHDNVPFYGSRLEAAGCRADSLNRESWSRLPVLAREEVQQAGRDLDSQHPPPQHGKPFDISSSGSTGVPVSVRKTPLANSVWKAITLRDHLWHGRDFAGRLCAIRDTEAILGIGKGHLAAYPKGIALKNWGSVTAQLFETGPAAALHIHTPIEQQAEWLQRQSPGMLVTFPSNLMRLAQYCRQKRINFPSLKSISTLGEVVTPSLRAAVREAWDLPVQDIYSAAEVGYIALQCPDHEHYHVQSEAALVEVVDAQGMACKSGEVGRVVITPLHNFATPLLRYAVGDYAEVGDPCPCGRGLPVLKRILGRTRNMLKLPTGQEVWPELEGATLVEVAPIRQFQVVQTGLGDLELRLVPQRPLTPSEEDGLRRMLRYRLQYDFAIAITYHQEIPRSRSGKYEDFKSELQG